jgi:hypothetical protein
MDGAMDTEARIAEIAAAVRVLSLTMFEFAGRRIETAPPLPRRYPALPLVERLQSELYGGAYCVPIGSGVAQQAVPAADMLATLSAANQCRTRVDPDWLVREVDPSGAVTVAKRGVVRRVPTTELMQQDAPAQPAAMPGNAPAVMPGQAQPPLPQVGRLLPIILPREHPSEGGFYFALGETVAPTFEGRAVVRFYWNVPTDAAAELMRVLTRTLNGHGVPFAFKCPRNAAAYERRDSGTLFVLRPFHRAARAMIPDIHRALAGRLRSGVPLFTQEILPGVGFAEDPGGNESFGMSRCRLLAEGLWTAFVEGASGTDAVLQVVKRHLMLNGIDLARPYLNPWSIDRYGEAA